MKQKGSVEYACSQGGPEAKVETKAKRNFRSAEERIAEIDRKIAFHSKSIEQLEIARPRSTRPGGAACPTPRYSRN